MNGRLIPKVSVVIPTHNRASMLQRAVDSVLAQTFTDFELLIVDDGSADETPDVVAGLLDQPHTAVSPLSDPWEQPRLATLAFPTREGEYIAFLDDDDEYLPTKIEEQVQVLDAASPEVGNGLCLVHTGRLEW